ncbi:MAG: HAMP domain-containing sensor histidine kinase [Phascolarctobacterium sp.]|nr:HAMP domain-containing sensor histidine kinase [Phascolarctobacterium sp.]
MRNKIAVKLAAYFGGVLLLFALVIGATFRNQFSKHTQEVQKKEITLRAQNAAKIISNNLQNITRHNSQGITDSKFIRDLDLVTGDFIVVIDAEHNLSLDREGMQNFRKKALEKNQNDPARNIQKFEGVGRRAPRTGKEAFELLPDEMKKRIVRCLKDGTQFTREQYNPFFHTVMVTVGVPIYGPNNDIHSVLLLNSNVEGKGEAAKSGVRILLLCLLVGFALCVLMSVLLSYRFTKPLKKMESNAELIAQGNYKVRNDIEQDDEIGDLADKLDEMAEKLGLAAEESQKLEKMRKDFIANISHELRTPVTVIRGSLEALNDGVVTETEDVKEFHDQMYKESIFLQRLINDLLDLSRLQNADFPIEKSPLNLCETILDAVRGARRMGAEKNISVSEELDTDMYMVNGDYGRIRQMLMVFLHNAVKFSPEDSSIEVSLQKNEIFVTDHGCGMSPADVEYAFERFHKAHNEQNKSGSGLGLAIARQIALRHDMELGIKSEEGKGTTIIVHLPDKLEADALTNEDEKHE